MFRHVYVELVTIHKKEMCVAKIIKRCSYLYSDIVKYLQKYPEDHIWSDDIFIFMIIYQIVLKKLYLNELCCLL